MDKTLKLIWDALGVPQVWGAVLTVLLVSIAYLLKKLIDVRVDRQKAELETIRSQYSDISEYVKEQAEGLIRAYVRIFESKEGVTASPSELAAIIAMADNDLMKPLRKYQAKLDSTTKSEIFRLHNILAQHYPTLSESAAKSFRGRKGEFYRYIHEALRSLKPDLILYRLGLLSAMPRGEPK